MSEARSQSLCWLCDRPIEDPPRIIGRVLYGETRVAHLECWRTLGEHDLELRAGEGAAPELKGRSGAATTLVHQLQNLLDRVTLNGQTNQ